jgi:starch synthase
MVQIPEIPKKEFKVKIIEAIAYALMSIVKKPFKVCLITYHYSENKKSFNNGVAVHAYYLSRELAKLGLEVHVFSRGEKNIKKTEYIGEGKVVVHRIDTKFKPGIKDNVIQKRISYFIFDNKIINEITKEHSRESFDMIHTHGWLTAGAFISKYFNDVKWIHTFHALEKNRVKFMSTDEKKYFEIAKWMESTINYSDALIAVSDMLKKEVVYSYPVSDEKVSYIPNGVDLELFNRNDNGDDKSILHIGRFSLEKGVDLLPGIINNILEKNKEIKFVLVASDGNIPPSLKKIKNELDELEKKYDRFIWHRNIMSREEVKELFKKCLIYIQPSRYEAFGLTVLEAMACGKAVIVSDIGGLSEVVENAGLVIPLKIDIFTKEILRLTDDLKLRERYGRRGFERAKLFSWEGVAKETFDLYKKII